MRPLSLTLKGFRGIRDGLGLDEMALDFQTLAGDAQLVALAGVNGRGKTTIIDNMHPYLTMPSRASIAGPGGFSYYEHICLAENEKDLLWEHDGIRYRSHVVIRLNGKRRTEAFLFAQHELAWKPVRLEDGTCADGKVEMYERCVEAICGSADTFFTSAFSAQGKPQLTAYKNAEIKSLLADLLGLDEVRTLAEKAAETAKLLKAGLTVIRQDQSAVDEELRRAGSDQIRLSGAEARLLQANIEKRTAQQALDSAREAHRNVAADRDRAQTIEAGRSELRRERQRIIDSDEQALSALATQERREQQRLHRLEQAVHAREIQTKARRRTLQKGREDARQILALAGPVVRATRRQGLAEQIVTRRAQHLDRLRSSVQRLVALQGDEKVALQRMVALQREAGQATLNAEELARRLRLTDEVPCSGTHLQGRCTLLGDARHAKALMPSADLQIKRLAQQHVIFDEELSAIRRNLEALSGAPARLALAERSFERSRAHASRLGLLAAKAGELTQARAALTTVEQELAALQQDDSPRETTDEKLERQQITAACRAIAAERARQAAGSRIALDRVESAIATLPKPFDSGRVVEAERKVQQAESAVTSMEQCYVAALRNVQAWELASRQASVLAERKAHVAARAGTVEAELSRWLLFAKCLSNDGVIALAIDDAGPALSALANDLLLACHGARFTVSIKTLVETRKGEVREGFDIIVHDSESEESKSVSVMSAGERVWINECLTRAIALYLAQHSGRRYTTLFSDETDGALDPERKRMFIQMKREVLRLGGYEREFFVSQTPELTALADAVIDLDAIGATAPAPVAP